MTPFAMYLVLERQLQLVSANRMRTTLSKATTTAKALKYRDLGKSKLHLAEEKQQYYTDLPYNGTIVDSADEDEPDLDEDNDK